MRTKADEIGNRHMNAEQVEKYSLGELSDEEAALFDEHLLLCEACRTNVEASDAYVAAMREAASLIRRQTGQAKRKGSRTRTRSATGSIG
jgi:anti-sigma factor RsiW